MSKLIGSFLIVGLIISILISMFAFQSHVEKEWRIAGECFLGVYTYLLLNCFGFLLSESISATVFLMMTSGGLFLMFPLIALKKIHSEAGSKKKNDWKNGFVPSAEILIGTVLNWTNSQYQKMFKEKFQGHENDYWKGHLISSRIPIDIE